MRGLQVAALIFMLLFVPSHPLVWAQNNPLKGKHVSLEKASDQEIAKCAAKIEALHLISAGIVGALECMTPSYVGSCGPKMTLLRVPERYRKLQRKVKAYKKVKLRQPKKVASQLTRYQELKQKEEHHIKKFNKAFKEARLSGHINGPKIAQEVKPGATLGQFRKQAGQWRDEMVAIKASLEGLDSRDLRFARSLLMARSLKSGFGKLARPLTLPTKLAELIAKVIGPLAKQMPKSVFVRMGLAFLASPVVATVTMASTPTEAKASTIEGQYFGISGWLKLMELPADNLCAVLDSSQLLDHYRHILAVLMETSEEVAAIFEGSECNQKQGDSRGRYVFHTINGDRYLTIVDYDSNDDGSFSVKSFEVRPVIPSGLFQEFPSYQKILTSSEQYSKGHFMIPVFEDTFLLNSEAQQQDLIQRLLAGVNQTIPVYFDKCHSKESSSSEERSSPYGRGRNKTPTP